MPTESKKAHTGEIISEGAHPKNPHTFYLIFHSVLCILLFILYYYVFYDWTYGGLILLGAGMEMVVAIATLSNYVEFKDTPDNEKPDYHYYSIFHWYYFDFMNWRKRRKNRK